MKSWFLYLGVGVALGVGLLLVGWQLSNQPYIFKGSTIEPAIQAPDFELTDQEGNPFRLVDQQGYVTLIFFGYTNCPDVCPTSLSEYKKIIDELGEQADGVRFVFVTVDPERDTIERLNTYLSFFHPAIVGLTGERAYLETVYKDYGVYQAKQDTGSAAGYLVDHTARTYVIDKQGNLRLTHPFEMDWHDIVEDVSHLLQEG